MPNAHTQTKQLRVPIRTATRLRLLAQKQQLTVATTSDQLVEDYLARHGHEDILAQTADLPEPRGALPPGVAVGKALVAE